MGRSSDSALSAQLVALNSRYNAALDDAVACIRSCGRQAVAVAGDVGLTETHVELAAQACKAFGGLAIAFNNATSVGPGIPLAGVDLME